MSSEVDVLPGAGLPYITLVDPKTGLQIQSLDNYSWAISVFDTSRILTLIVSIALIVYGSFRAIKVEAGNTEDEKNPGTKNNESTSKYFNFQGLHTIESSQAIALPIGASFSLLLMFFFFDSLQLLFTIMTAALATVAFSFLLLPLCQQITSPCFNVYNRVSFGCCGRFTPAEITSLMASSVIVLLWILTGHWLLMDALAMALCVAMIAFVRLPSLKVSVVLLMGLLLYDVFWVFLSEYIFNVNVMVKVATQPAYNPANYLSKKLHLDETMHIPAKLSLPGKLVFPSYRRTGHFSMLGLGDIVMPGLLLCFVLRFDNLKKQTDTSHQPPSSISYFHYSLIGYFVGLVTATIASEVSKAAQPALIYLVPFTILPLIVRAYIKGDLRQMWSNPFKPQNAKYELV